MLTASRGIMTLTHPAPGLLAPAKTQPKMPPYRLASKLTRSASTIVSAGNATVGGERFAVIAGPCSVEDEHQLVSTAKAVRDAGASMLRGGAFKPRSSPYSFQGLAEEGLKLLHRAKEVTGLPIVTEVMDSEDIPLVASYADVLQVGTRNSQNFSLLKKLGKIRKPILLKRGLMTTLEEFLMSAEYILAAGNHQVILCERGIRTFETATRNTLDLSAIPVLKERTHLPVIVDPSHAVGHSRFVIPMARAAMAVGADGIMVEVHYKPEEALCDGDQSLDPGMFTQLMNELRSMAGLVSRAI
jgi:3-deoxy-7-phosphoheptulonate synthase